MTNGSVLQENILSLINERPVKHCIVFYTGLWTWLVEVPVYVCVDFSLGELYTNFIQNQIKGFKNLSIILENRLTSKTDIFVSDSVIESLSITQIIWKRPPTPLDWEMFGDAIVDVKNKSKRM